VPALAEGILHQGGHASARQCAGGYTADNAGSISVFTTISFEKSGWRITGEFRVTKGPGGSMTGY
jgi:hypothetical protein